jgi:hypothetical protein
LIAGSEAFMGNGVSKKKDRKTQAKISLVLANQSILTIVNITHSQKLPHRSAQAFTGPKLLDYLLI